MTGIKKTTIDLTSDLNSNKFSSPKPNLMNSSSQRESKVTFSPNMERRSDSVDNIKYESNRGNRRKITVEDEDSQ